MNWQQMKLCWGRKISKCGALLAQKKEGASPGWLQMLGGGNYGAQRKQPLDLMAAAVLGTILSRSLPQP